MVKTKTNLMKLKEIKKQHQGKKIGRFSIDVQTANAILTIHKNLGSKNKAKYTRIINSDLRKASAIAWRMV